MSIHHLEQLHPKDALAFLDCLENKSIIITEKVDGMFMTLDKGENNVFSLSTKNCTFYAAKDIPVNSLLVFQDVERYFNELKDVVDCKITGEAMPSADFNTVPYSKNKVKDGAFVVLSIERDGGKLTQHEVLTYCKAINKRSKIIFYPTPYVGLPEQDNRSKAYVKDTKKFINKNFDALTKPARTDEKKAIKAELRGKLEKHLLTIKYDILRNYKSYKSILGSEVEGFIVQYDQKVVKLIDKEKFTQKNLENWKILSELSSFNKTLNESFSIKDYSSKTIEQYKKYINDIVTINEQAKVEHKTMVSRLLKETDFAIGLAKSKIEQMEKSISLRDKVDLGRAVHGINSAVALSHAQPTIVQAMRYLGLSDVPWIQVGNKNKPYSGDIDIAISEQHLRESLNINDNIDLFEFIKAKFSIYDVGNFVINKGLKQFHIAFPMYDSNGKIIKAIDPDTLEFKDEDSLVQLDFLVGDLNWMSKVLLQPGKSKYKMAVRNLFLKAMCEARNVVADTSSMEYSLNFRDGLWVKIFDLMEPTGRQKKVQKEEVSRFKMAEDKVLSFLFPYHKVKKPFGNFETLYDDFIDKVYQQNPELGRKTLEIFKTLCEKNHFEVPEKVIRLLNNEKIVALFPGAFKPFHRGHFEILTKLADEADEVRVLMSISDRENISGAKAVYFMENYCIPYFPSNVKVEYTKNPIGYAHKIGHLNKTANIKTLLFIDERESTGFDASLFDFRSSSRLGSSTNREWSGTALRAAIRSGNHEEVRRHLVTTNWLGDQIELLSAIDSEKSLEQYSLLLEKLNQKLTGESNG